MVKGFEDRYKTGQKSLSHSEYSKLISVITDLVDELLIKFAVAEGLRREDLVEIKLSNIDKVRRTLLFHEHKKDRIQRELPVYEIINGNRIKHKGKIIFGLDGKPIKDEKWRTINLQPNLIIIIEKYWNSLSKEKKKKHEQKDRLFLFTGRTAYNKLNYWCKVAGIPTRPFHALRATCIKFCHDAGWSDEQIQTLTGDTISVIQRHYMTPSTSEMADVTSSKGFI